MVNSVWFGTYTIIECNQNEVEYEFNIRGIILSAYITSKFFR